MISNEIINSYQNKHVHINLKNGYFYSGQFLRSDEHFIHINDRRNGFIALAIDEIARIQEARQ